MKTKPLLHLLGLCAALSCTLPSAQAQGFVKFNNRVVGAVVAPIYGTNSIDATLAQTGMAVTNGGTQDYTGYPLLVGTSYTAQLWGGPLAQADAGLAPVSSTIFGTNATRGFIVAPTSAVAIASVPAGTQAWVRVRAWDNLGGTVTTWAAAQINPAVASGESPGFAVGPLGSNTTNAPNLTNLVSFNIHLPCLPPGITSEPQSQTACLSNSATFSVTATGTGPLNYQWKRGTTNLGTGPTLTLTNVVVGQTATNYFVIITNNCGSVTSQMATLRVDSTIFITCPARSTNRICGTSAPATFANPTVTGGTLMACVPASGSVFSVGTNNITCTATNACGSNTCSFNLVVQQIAPVTLTCPAARTTNGCNITTVVTFANPTVTSGALMGCVPASGSAFPLGTNTVTCTATNACGTNTCSFTITVGQAQGAALTCSGNITNTICGASAVVVFANPTVTVGQLAGCVPPSGSVLPLGVTNVICTATNRCGTNTCSFTLTVAPVPAVIITCPASVTNKTCGTNAVVTFANPTVGPGNLVGCVPASGSVFSLGTTPVLCTATNRCYTNTCAFNVVVEQRPAVVVSCPANILTNISGTNVVVSFPNPTVTNGTLKNCVPPSGSIFSLGTTVVTCTATNICGSNTCSFGVMVQRIGTGCLFFAGLENCPLGSATLNISSNKLVTSNLGTNGQDGVKIVAGDAREVRISLEIATNSFVDGASLTLTDLGQIGALTDQPIGSLRAQRIGTSLLWTPDVSALGASNYTLQIFNGGQLVYSEVRSGPAFGTDWPPTNPPPAGISITYYSSVTTDSKTNTTKNNCVTVDFKSAIHVGGGGPTVIGDTVMILAANPGNTLHPLVSGIRVQAAGLGEFTLIDESALPLPLLFDGLGHLALGSATLNISSNKLVTSNLGTNGQDGVKIVAGDAREVRISLEIATNSFVDGASLTLTDLGQIGALTDQPIGSLRAQRIGTSLLWTPDVSALGASNYTLQIFNGGQLVYSEVRSGPAFGTDWPPTNPPPAGISITYYSSVTTDSKTNTTKNNCVTVDFKSAIHVGGGGPTVIGDTVMILAANPGNTLHPLVSGIRVQAAGLGELAIVDEAIDVFGLLHRALGQASLSAGGTNLTVANIGTNGLDGVKIALGQALSCDFSWLPLDSNALGAWVQLDFTGSVNGVTNHSLGSARVTCGIPPNGYLISADLTPINSLTERLEVWRQDVLLAVFPGQPTGVVAQASIWPTGGGKSGRGSPPYILGCISIGWPFPTDLLVNGTHFMADQLLILQESAPSINYLSGVSITAASVPEIDITEGTVVPLRPHLTAAVVSGSNIIIQWSGGGVLQQSADLLMWTDVPGAASPYSAPINSPKRFFRVQQ